MPTKLAIGAGVLGLLLGTVAPACAQQHEPTEERRAGQQEQLAAQPAQQQRHEQPQQTYGGVYHGGVQPNGPMHGGVHDSGVPQHQEQVRSGFGQSRASNWAFEHRTWRQRGGYNGYRIPEERFRIYFGHQHYFRIAGLPMLFVGGFPRFQYDGYWFTFIDPWPGEWPANWYETDNVYVDYVGDGYYLYDLMHPGVPIAVTISF